MERINELLKNKKINSNEFDEVMKYAESIKQGWGNNQYPGKWEFYINENYYHIIDKNSYYQFEKLN